MDIGEIVRRAGARFGPRPLVADRSVQRTYAEFEDRTARLAAGLLQQGFRSGDRIGIALPQRVAFLEAVYGVLRAGLVAVPLSWRLHPRELAAVVEDAGLSLLFVEADLAGLRTGLVTGGQAPCHVVAREEDGEPFAELLAAERCELPRRSADDLAVLLYTSGTTGKPKGVMLNHSNWLYAGLGLVLALDLEADDVAVLSTPLSHAAGFVFFAHLLRGGRAVLLPAWDPEAFLEAMAREGGTITFFVPTMLYGLLDHPSFTAARLTSLRTLYYSSAPVSPARLREAVRARGPRLVQSYGLIDAPMPSAVLDRLDHARLLDPDGERLAASAGREFLLAELRVVNERGEEAHCGEVGEVVVRGPHVARGYWRQDALNARAVRDGWLYTGDLAYRDADGYLFLVDRKHDAIITGGLNVYPREIEEVLAAHPGVDEVVVLGAPDDYWGEAPVAMVVARAGWEPNADDLLAFCRERLPGYKRPRRIEIVAELPRNSSGKIRRHQLREQLWQGHPRRVH